MQTVSKKEHVELSTISKKQLTSICKFTPEEAKTLHRYRTKVPVIIEAEDGTNQVDGRELHKQLGIKTRFNDWVNTAIKTNRLVKGVDYQEFYSNPSKTSGGRPSTEYQLTVDTAKILGMQCKSEAGDAIRRYFLLCEKALKHMYAYNPPRLLSKANHKKLQDWYGQQETSWKDENQPQNFFPKVQSFICKTATGKYPVQWKRAGLENPQQFLDGEDLRLYLSVQDATIRLLKADRQWFDVVETINDMYAESGSDVWRNYTKSKLVNV